MCTGLRIICEDGSVLVGRTLEFGINFNYKNYIDNKIKGIKAFCEDKEESYLIDGLNKYGICVTALYFPEFIDYSDDSIKGKVNISSIQVVEYLLTNSKSLEDIHFLCKNMIVLNKIYEPAKLVIPLHWFCCDDKGNSIVIECVKGIPVIYENKYGIITNSPTFPEHIKTIENKEVKSLTPYNKEEKAKIQGQDFSYSDGTGFIGLPGDYSSISRFIKVHILQKFHKIPDCTHKGINTIFHILNNFDIVRGSNIDNNGNYIYTKYTIIYSLKFFEFFYKMYDDFSIYKI